MPTYVQLIDSQPDSLSRAGAALTTAGERLDGLTNSFGTAVQRTNGVWVGDAQQAQTKAADRLRTQIEGIGANFREVASLVQAARAEVSGAPPPAPPPLDPADEGHRVVDDDDLLVMASRQRMLGVEAEGEPRMR